MSFLPDNYKKPSAGGNYVKTAKGENRMRIVTSPIVGRVDRDKTGDKPAPIRTTEKNKPLNDNSKPKHFRAMGVLQDGEVKVWEITQSSIQDAIIGLTRDEDRGDPKEYDLVVIREGDGMETKYSVIPKPKKPLSKEEQEVIESTYLNLEALYDGENPFEDQDLGEDF